MQNATISSQRIRNIDTIQIKKSMKMKKKLSEMKQPQTRSAYVQPEMSVVKYDYAGIICISVGNNEVPDYDEGEELKWEE